MYIEDETLHPPRWVKALQGASPQVRRALLDAGIDERLPSLETFIELLDDAELKKDLVLEGLQYHAKEFIQESGIAAVMQDVEEEIDRIGMQARRVRRRTADLTEAEVARWALVGPLLSTPPPSRYLLQ